VIASGLRIGRYEVGDRLGKGSFGVVHLARDVELGRDIAIKVLKPEYLGKPSVVQRFLKEARAAATIGHPGIVTVFECGQIANTGTRADGNAYIAMELLRGESLTDRIGREGRLPVETVIAIGRQLASALAAAHGAGIIHRDLKPDNVFLIPDSAVHGGERVKLLDFGMAKLTELDGAPQTHSKMILGTPRYMSPEQARSSAKIDHRTDIYALGCILYELACGRPPFAGDAGEVIVQHQSAPLARPSSIVDVPTPLDALIVSMLAKQPDERPQSMADVERELAAASTQEIEPPTGVYPPKRSDDATTQTAVSDVTTTLQDRWRVRWRSPLVIALAATGLVLGGLLTFLLLSPSRKIGAPLAADAPRLAAAPPDAAAEVPTPRTPASEDANRMRAECQALLDGQQWQALRECAQRLDAVDGEAARAFAERATRGLAPDTDAKRVECKQYMFDKKWQDAIGCAKALRDPAAPQILADANAEAAAEAALRRLGEAASRGQQRVAKKELDQIPASSVYRKEAEATYHRIDTPSAKTVAAAPPSPPASCDAAALRASGGEKLSQGLDAAALVDFEAAIRCGAGGDIYVKAFMAACRSRHEPKARQLYKSLPADKRESISQICVRNGITF